MSGNVLETRALDQLLPDWMESAGPPRTLAVRDRFYFLTEKRALRLPTPPQMKNKKRKNQIISLRSAAKWHRIYTAAALARVRAEVWRSVTTSQCAQRATNMM